MKMTVAAKTEGLAQAYHNYEEYGNHARELKKQGRKIMGYLCAFTPLEILHAAGYVPIRIKGNSRESITVADTQMETLVCPLVRHAYDLAYKNTYDYLDGIIIPHACDSISKTYQIWQYTLGVHYAHFINTPHGTDESCQAFFESELRNLVKSLSRHIGEEITCKKLVSAIGSYNFYRSKIRELYELRKSDPPLISGEEITKVMVAGLGMPVEEAITMVSNVIADVKKRTPVKNNKPRIMVIGAEIDDSEFIKLIEDCGSVVVTDDLCPGLREYSGNVTLTQDPVKGIAHRYLMDINCGRTYRERAGSYAEYLDYRFGHIKQRINDYNVDGVILYIYRFCDPYGFEVPAMKSYIEGLNKPVFHLEGNYAMSDIGRLHTRVQAFIEQLHG
jgi:benzoyl-CoA reductase subunit C